MCRRTLARAPSARGARLLLLPALEFMLLQPPAVTGPQLTADATVVTVELFALRCCKAASWVPLATVAQDDVLSGCMIAQWAFLLVRHARGGVVYEENCPVCSANAPGASAPTERGLG